MPAIPLVTENRDFKDEKESCCSCFEGTVFFQSICFSDDEDFLFSFFLSFPVLTSPLSHLALALSLSEKKKKKTARGPKQPRSDALAWPR
jgi:hypothetical protein